MPSIKSCSSDSFDKDDWWKDSIKAGSSYKTVKAKRFMPRLLKSANTNYAIRSPKTPLASPYRDGIVF